MAETELLPPVPTETEEERRRRLNPAPAGNTMPPVPVPASERTTANTTTLTPTTGRTRDLAIGATAQPTIPPLRPVATTAPDIGAPGPAMPPVRVNPGQPARPAPNPFEAAKEETPAVQPGTMPPVKVGPQQKAYEDLSAQGTPKLTGWRKALDAIGSIFPIGRAIETAIPGSPQNYNAKLNNAALAAAKEQTIGAGQREAESAAAKAQFDTPEKRRAYIAQHPDEFEGVDDFQKNDFILAGKFPQREPPAEKEKIGTTPEEVTLHDLMTGDNGKPRINPDTQKPFTYLEAYEAVNESKAGAKPEKVDKKIDEFVDPKNNRVNVMQRPDGSTYNVVRGQSRSEAGVGSPSDVKDIAGGIIAGLDPPDLMKYGYRDRTAIAAELKRQGFDLARASQDWLATQKHLATMNGAQQERLRQAVSFTDDSLGIIDGLYNEWQRVGPTAGWKLFNKASLATAKQLPGDAGNLAHRLEAQISDLTSELGTVYKGGNTSTDESLKLAAKNLEADWNEKTFKDAINQIRQNLEIRKNSIRHSQPAGVSENSPYTPKSETETPKDFGAAPQGKKEGDTGKLPDGTKIIVKGGRIVAQ